MAGSFVALTNLPPKRACSLQRTVIHHHDAPLGQIIEQDRAADAKLVKEVLKEGDFNDYYIKCVGKHVTIKLNGKTTVDDDFPKMPEEGIIAFQIHGGPSMDVTFKNIAFKELK